MPRDRLSPLDASFLYLDGPVTCNQAISINVLDGPIDFDRFCDEMRRKVGYIDRLRQIPVFSPFNLFHPTWNFDPTFDIRNHVRQLDLPAPGSEEQLRNAVEGISRIRLDRNRPLWSVYAINGLSNDRSAYLLVLHHAISDGIGFARMASVFFDTRPYVDIESRELQTIKPLPGGDARLFWGAADAVSALPRFLSTIVNGFAKLIHAFLSPEEGQPRKLLRRFRSAPALRLPFNAPLSGQLSYSNASFDLQDIARIRAKHGGTINDVLLTIVTTAVQRYASAEGIETESTYLRLLVPSNVRSDDTQETPGNFVAMSPVLAPLGEIPVSERLQMISGYTQAMKQCGLAKLISLSITLSQSMLTPPISRLAHRLFASPWLQRKMNRPNTPPSFNLVVTNVPGPPMQTYIAGQKIVDISVLVPLLPSIGLVCGGLSHQGKLSVTFTGDKKLVPDIDALSSYSHDAFRELLEA
ncbi:MAG: wax ester/triacylglycerol synthase family O-acyltransferase [Candidatus Hydrogenedentes bacterium]|nr:wax ester/triacylglycerol synthase family O-acyltransferase [Candidatus Hydrogenedentota bacterium]